ncbi:MAG: hypothetical protein U5L10_02725 [Candidatus Moranbacteria bacterium]|nr:hypothetical protein [Candidatus Moranbacteria bacterium]
MRFPGSGENNTFIRKASHIPWDKFEETLNFLEGGIYQKAGYFLEFLEERKIEKSNEQIAVIRFIKNEVLKILKHYSAKQVDLEIDRIYIVNDKIFERLDIDPVPGMSFSLRNIVMINTEEKLGNTALASVLAHELFHQFSFEKGLMTAKAADQEGPIIRERSGLSVVINNDVDNRYLKNLDEAITTELEFQVMKKVKNHDLFRGDYEIIKKEFDKDRAQEAVDLIYSIDENGDVLYLYSTPYREQRANLKKVINDIFEFNQDKFSTAEEIFDIFVKAYFDGNIIPITRLLKKTYGNRPIKEIIQEVGL